MLSLGQVNALTGTGESRHTVGDTKESFPIRRVKKVWLE